MPPPLTSPGTRAQSILLSLGFALTGFGMALPGAALPALLAHWHLQDRGGGLLFLLAWFGTTGGALLARGDATFSVVRGAVLTAVALLALTVIAHPWIYPAMLAYGLGLGITMTSISLLRAEQTAAALALSLTEPAGSEGRTAHTPAHEMNRLNMVWAVGALVAPPLTAQVLRTNSPGPLLVAFGASFLAVAGATLLTRNRERAPTASASRSAPRAASLLPQSVSRKNKKKLPQLPMAFAGFAALSVGIEAALGGWLTTYTQRAQHGVSAEVSVTAALWAGLLLSRALHTTRLVHKLTPARWLQIHTSLTVVSVCLLAATHAAIPLLVLTLAAGFALGPLYPMALGYVLPRYRGRMIFVLAGIGSAVLPWATGALSSHWGSLREALFIPCLAAVGMAGLAVLLLRTTAFGEAEEPLL